MDLFLIFIIAISLLNINFFIKGFNKEYLSFTSTNCVKGIFLLFVFFSHSLSYIKVNHWYDSSMLYLQAHLKQLIVVLFFFYSGYGIYEAIKKNKENYVNSMPRKRILKTLFNFSIAIILFIITNLLLHNKMTCNQILLSFIGWDSVGNSNWFIFDSLVLYLISYISFKAFGSKKGIISTWLYTLIFILFLIIFKQGWWYNTLLCFPLGITYSYYKNEIERVITKNNVSYLVALFMAFFATFCLTYFYQKSIWYYELWAVSFTILIILCTMKVYFRSPILEWIGKHLFWLYILQRIPFMILSHIGYNTMHPYRFFIVSFFITILFSAIMAFLVKKMTNSYNKANLK